mgnify:FL=1
MSKPTLTKRKRLLSLDAYRGITMFLLIAESALLWQALLDYFPEGSFGHAFALQFHHHPWNGLRFWDLIQPFFMFIVGVAMPFSMTKRLERGDSWNEVFRHILRRCLLLFLFGVGLHCVYSHALVWELWNVLTQLSFTILVAFLILRWDLRAQLGVSIAFLVLTEILYRVYNPEAPYQPDGNFGDYVDLLLMGKLNGGHWVAINILPTAAHTIWGAICGWLLLSDRTEREKIRIFVAAGVVGLLLGYGLDGLGITPIVKRIATTAFTLASGGWCLLTLALFYWLIDVKGANKWITAFVIVGMNPIFIYLFTQTVGHQWVVDFVHIFNDGFLGPLGLPDDLLNITNALLTLGLFWYLCYWLFRHRIFIKI